MTSLHESIEQMVRIGESDPLSIARKILERNDPDWVREELGALAEDLIAEMARRELGSRRRSAELALEPGDAVTQGELQLAKLWIPGEGWKRAADLSSEDLRARARWYELLASASMRRAEWCRQVAELMDAEGAPTLGDLQAQLPALPDAAEIAAA